MPQQQQGNDSDELYEVKTNFYIGNYQTAINEANKLKVSTPEMKLERDIFLYRAYIALRKYGVVINEISGSSSQQLQALKTLAEYFAQPSKREAIVAKLDQQMSGSLDVENYAFCLAAATIYYNEAAYENALKVLHQSDHLECHTLMLQIYLKMDRIDLARKELKTLQEKDDDAIVTQLASSWVNLLTGGDKLQEAYYTFTELADKNTTTALLLNGQATCYIGQGKYEEAESALQEALEKDSNNSDTLVNLIVLSQIVGKAAEVTSRYLSQLKDSAPEHPLVKDMMQKEREFELLSNQYAESA
nr:EOG090X0A8E [Leptodora kindtii]